MQWIQSLHGAVPAERSPKDNQGRPHEEATSLQDAVLSVIMEPHVIPATPCTGTAAIVLTIVALPGPLPTVPHVLLPIVHCPGALLDLTGTPNPKGTSRMLYR